MCHHLQKEKGGFLLQYITRFSYSYQSWEISIVFSQNSTTPTFSSLHNIISYHHLIFHEKITDKCHVGSMDGPQVVLRIYRHVSPPQRIIATSLIARSLGITEVDVHISDPIFSSQPMGLSRSDFLGYWLPKRSRG